MWHPRTLEGNCSELLLSRCTAASVDSLLESPHLQDHLRSTSSWEDQLWISKTLTYMLSIPGGASFNLQLEDEIEPALGRACIVDPSKLVTTGSSLLNRLVSGTSSGYRMGLLSWTFDAAY
jgi:hypothetical protein